MVMRSLIQVKTIVVNRFCIWHIHVQSSFVAVDANSEITTSLISRNSNSQDKGNSSRGA